MSLPEPIPPSRRVLLIHLFRSIVKPVTRERRAEVTIQLRDSSHPDFDFFLLVILSSIIATSGLLTNSPAVIIGAMLVAPLMSPILGLGLASLTGDATFFRNAGIALARGAAIAILIATLLTLLNRLLPFLPLQELPGEVLARTRPTPIDLTIALAGGMAAAFALAMPSISAALPGVAIATALMPPLCTVGVGIAMGRWDVAGGALLLFITNAVTIAFAAMLVLSAVGFSVKREEGAYCAARACCHCYFYGYPVDSAYLVERAVLSRRKRKPTGQRNSHRRGCSLRGRTRRLDDHKRGRYASYHSDPSHF